MGNSRVVWGALRYEFQMQVRRPAVWVGLTLVAAIPFVLWQGIGDHYLHGHYSDRSTVWVPAAPAGAVLLWAEILTFLLPLAVGLVLADRLARDRTTHVAELLETLPGALGARLAGKYLGSTLATLLPVGLLYAAGIGDILIQVPDASMVPLAAAAFAAVVLPGSLFAAGFSIAVPAVLRVPLYQFLFVGYWFWANLMSPKIGLPSPVGTMLNATGPWALEGFFDFQWTFLILHATAAQAAASIVLLVGLGLLALTGGWGYLSWEQARR
ncbi:MAG TPA: hypothetical protein VKY74_23215 [Chloroflexia bacterium]|nr:hypothetical protein [Chloroflexia bacterium]